MQFEAADQGALADAGTVGGPVKGVTQVPGSYRQKRLGAGLVRGYRGR